MKNQMKINIYLDYFTFFLLEQFLNKNAGIQCEKV